MPTANKDAATSERARGESSTDNSREEIDEVLLAGSSSDYSGLNPSPCAQVSAKLSDVGVGLKGLAPNPNCCAAEPIDAWPDERRYGTDA